MGHGFLKKNSGTRFSQFGCPATAAKVGHFSSGILLDCNGYKKIEVCKMMIAFSKISKLDCNGYETKIKDIRV